MSSQPASITLESRVGEIAANHPAATRSLHRHQIDFCCGGGLPLDEACRRKDVDPELVLEDIHQEIEATSDENSEDWTNRPLNDLVDHIIEEYHNPLREELPRLHGMLDKVVRVHGHYDPERMNELSATFSTLRTELEHHMEKEEKVLFPMAGMSGSLDPTRPVAVLEHEHEEAGEALRTIRSLTDDYTPPSFACNTWRALWGGLSDLEKAMHEHIHLENNILFPRMTTAMTAVDAT